MVQAQSRSEGFGADVFDFATPELHAAKSPDAA
jgi:hypothetical protein